MTALSGSIWSVTRAGFPSSLEDFQFRIRHQTQRNSWIWKRRPKRVHARAREAFQALLANPYRKYRRTVPELCHLSQPIREPGDAEGPYAAAYAWSRRERRPNVLFAPRRRTSRHQDKPSVGK